MKKITSILIASILCMFCYVSVGFAENSLDENSGLGSTELTYSVEESYVVVIPEDISLDETIKITSTKANTEPNYCVRVRISNGLDDGKATLDRDIDTSDYAITVPVLKDNEPVSYDTEIAAFSDVVEETVGGEVTFGTPMSPDDNEIKAGSYTGSLTFQISYEEK